MMKPTVAERWIARLCPVGLVFAGACGGPRAPVDQIVVPNPMLGAMTVAVAPAVNLSGSTDFDPNRVADLMAAELMHAERVSVIPVSRVIAVLSAQGTDRVASPGHASEIAAMVGADAILVFAVTEYSPYDPPRVAMSVQLFAATPRAAPIEDGSGAGEPADVAQASRVLAQVQRRFDASHADVEDDLRRYARQRSADHSPYGWRKYVVSQQHYLQYCCHAAIRGLLSGQGWAVRTAGSAN